MKIAMLIQRLILKLLNILLPYNSTGDNIYINLRYLIKNGKLFQGQEKVFNDYLTKRMLSNVYYQPKYQITSCKYNVKKYLAEKGLHDHIVPTIQLIEKNADLEKFEFPDRCVIKSTAGSGQIIFKKNKDIKVEKENIARWFKKNHYHKTREKNYKTLDNMVIVEPFVFDSDEVLDYKMFFSNGKLTATQVDIDRHSNHKRNFYDRDWNKLDFTLKYPSADKEIKTPRLYHEMIFAGKIIVQDFDFVRIDFYTNHKTFYIGEITHVHGSGLEETIPRRLTDKMSLTLLGANCPKPLQN